MDTEFGYEPVQNAVYSGEVDVKKTLDLSRLKGKTILITGGASGFGAACARLWAENGANLMIGDINTKLGLELVADLRKSTKNEYHQFFTCDVTQWPSLANFFKEAAKASPHKGLDIVMANAGIANGEEGNLFESAPDYSKMDAPATPDIMKTLDVNLRGVYYTSHLALSYLSRNPGSKPCSNDETSDLRDRQLILVASVAGLLPVVRLAPYCTAKHGVVGLFRSLRVTAPLQHGIRVNMVCPYFVKTPLLKLDAQLVLAGGALADVGAVIDVLTRFVTDQSIIGRGLVVGPEASEGQARTMNLPHAGPAWDVYADDFGQTDIFTRRIIGITNLQAQAKGWMGMYKDLFVAFTSPFLRHFFA